MRRLLILSVVLSVLIGLGGPVTAKPGKPKPPAPPPLDVSIDANLWIWNVPGDEILFDLIVENASSTAISHVAISLTIDGVVVYTETVALAGRGEWSYPDPGFSYIVVPESREDTDPVTATLTASFGDGSVVDTVTVDGPGGDLWLGPCFEDSPVFEVGQPVVFDVDVGGFCHHQFEPGYWTIVAEPAPGERLALTMRDHVAGNWCMLDEPIRGKPKAPLTIDVFIPGLEEGEFELPEGMEWDVKWRGPGVCLLGGRGICTDDDCYFPIGNPAEFVLATPAGMVTATFHGDTQP